MAEGQQGGQSEMLWLGGGYNFLGKQFSNAGRGPLIDTVVPIQNANLVSNQEYGKNHSCPKMLFIALLT